ncbi:hypothetical protein HAP47_0033210 [Bradyrhizobium sp. 41S5]|uniref:hypothetical protein n=1 Tax=Bradyrhizobium sp. 41S5 TaxID=1404443 RepID=UPI00156BA907|nr:hypothetical protein [Bradyrhizobium sp. 41S5]UFX44015.1 hypothetical protein HAP47_0033210 [Bradyrhizobium sp. 41S5]
MQFSEEFAFSNRQLHNHPDLLSMCANAVDIVAKSACRGVQFEALQNRPLIRLHVDSKNDDAISSNESLAVALLINDEQYTQSNEKIKDSVLSKNRKHNRKGEKAKRILINKQGYLVVTNATAIESALASQEIAKRERMYELGWVLHRFYETYPTLRQEYTREM